MNNLILDVNENLKNFPIGSRLKILMTDGPAFVAPGTHGTVTKVTENATIIVRVPDGREVPLYVGRDAFVKLHD